jgi:hypothetical protein
MRKFMYLFAAFELGATLFAHDQFSGTWKMDPSESTGSAVPKEETLVIMMAAMFNVTIIGTDADGTPIAVTYIVPTTGGSGQVS